MKKLIAVIGLLLCTFLAQAQVDSFKVNGIFFRFHIPQGWILEQNNNGVKDDSYWNVVIRHQVNEPKFYANLAIKVEKRPFNTNSSFVPPKHTSIVSGLGRVANTTIGFVNIETPKNKCSNCRKAYTDLTVYYLNEDLDLVVAFSGYGKKKLLDSLRKFFSPFQENFFSGNQATLKSFLPLVQQQKNLHDSVLIGKKTYLVSYDSGWTITNRKDPLDTKTPTFMLDNITPAGRHVSIFIDPILLGDHVAHRPNDRPSRMMHTPITGGPPSVQNDPLKREKPQNILLRQDTTRFTSNSFFNQIIVPDHFYPTSVSYLVTSTDSSLAGYTLVFTICSSEAPDDLLKEYYAALLEAYINTWLLENNINAVLERKGNSAIPVQQPEAPSPAPPVKKTKAE